MKKAFTTNIFSPLDFILWGLLCIAINLTIAALFTGKADITIEIALAGVGLVLGTLEYFKNRAIEKEDLQNSKYTDNCE